ncbi:MAG: toprim domain-containing protein [bacterium]|nr:toprim domain-containing protein [bacterium]
MNPIDRLIQSFERFPGIGPRQARRFVQYLLSEGAGYRADLADTIKKLGVESRQCAMCFRWFVKNGTKGDLCSICSSTARDTGLLFVVEKDADVENVERSGFRGLYFVLGGTIPLASETPQKHVRMKELFKRVEAGGANPEGDNKTVKLKEVILGLSATTEGDHTRLLLQEKMMPVAEGFGFKLSSLGRGLSTGSELEYADPDTISQALANRT